MPRNILLFMTDQQRTDYVGYAATAAFPRRISTGLHSMPILLAAIQPILSVLRRVPRLSRDDIRARLVR